MLVPIANPLRVDAPDPLIEKASPLGAVSSGTTSTRIRDGTVEVANDQLECVSLQASCKLAADVA